MLRCWTPSFPSSANVRQGPSSISVPVLPGVVTQVECFYRVSFVTVESLGLQQTMARPRVFISSTFYDLRYVRSDLERFIRELGYDPVLSERGHVAYGRTEALEQDCYREITNCDILINIVGPRFGSEASTSTYSVSQVELKTAHELNKQVYVFVERAVHVEYNTWLLNRNSGNFTPRYVDDIRIYAFIKEVYDLKLNNNIAEFNSMAELIAYLREQWAGLFHRYLQENSRREDYKISKNLKSTSETLAEIIKYTTRERDATIRSIMVHGHPVFAQLREAADIPIRVQFLNRTELTQLLAVFDYFPIDDAYTDFYTYVQRSLNGETKLEIDHEIFDGSENIRPVASEDWNKNFVTATRTESNDDVPF